MARSNGNVNDVAMQGSGVYKRNSELQREGLLRALPLLQAATEACSELGNDLLRVVDYGAAHGNNSLLPLETILSTTTSPRVLIELNDRPENDFTTTAATLNEWQQKRNEQSHTSNLYVGMIPRSFYQRVAPPQSIHLAYCFTAIHFFENLPHLPDGHFEPAMKDAVLETQRKQAQTDLQKFLSLRAEEIVPNGQLVLSICATGFGQPDFFSSGPGECIRLAMHEMYMDGTIDRNVLNKSALPCYFRTLEDVTHTLDDVRTRGCWDTISISRAQVMHPAWGILESQKTNGSYTREHSIQYATAMIDWHTAVSAGYFIKAVKDGSIGCVGDDRALDLLEDMKRRASNIFHAKFKDAPVYGSFIYVHLQRK